jgi:hypothetical protein
MCLPHCDSLLHPAEGNNIHMVITDSIIEPSAKHPYFSKTGLMVLLLDKVAEGAC